MPQVEGWRLESVLCVLRPRRAAEKCGLSDGNTQSSQRDRVQPIHQTGVRAHLPSPAVSSLCLEGRGMARVHQDLWRRLQVPQGGVRG